MKQYVPKQSNLQEAEELQEIQQVEMVEQELQSIQSPLHKKGKKDFLYLELQPTISIEL